MNHIKIKAGDAVKVIPDDDIEEAWEGVVVSMKATKAKVKDQSDDPSCHGCVFTVDVWDLQPNQMVADHG